MTTPLRTRLMPWPLLCLTIALLLLAACARPAGPAAVAEPATTVTPLPLPTLPGVDDWARIQAAGKLTVGVSADYAPFSYYTPNFMLDGFDIALMRELGRRLGVELELQDFAFEGLLGALQLGQIDVAIAAISVTPQRLAQADFTNIYYTGEDAILARTGESQPVATPGDLAGRRIGVQLGSVYATWAQQELVATGLITAGQVIAYSDSRQAIAALQAGEVDLVMLDAIPAQLVERQGGVEVVGQGLAPQSYALAVRKGSTLLDQLNRALVTLQNEGTVGALAEAYLKLPANEILPQEVTPPAPTPAPAAPLPCIDGMALVAHLNYDDQLMSAPPIVAPGEEIRKGWQVRNNGNCPWGLTYALQYIGGNLPATALRSPTQVLGQSVAANGVADLYVELVAPVEPGRYQGFWQLVSTAGVPFGQRLAVGLEVSTE
jgi:ABC-type amino acid transport substrate-binding protein